MSNPLSKNPVPDDVLPYAPTWARQSGEQRWMLDDTSDTLLDGENPGYREIAERFSPRRELPPKRPSTSKMWLRFGGVVAVAGTALALFVGYAATHGQGRSVPKDTRPTVATLDAATPVQAALASPIADAPPEPAPPVPPAAPEVAAPVPHPAPVAEPATPQIAALPEEPLPPAPVVPPPAPELSASELAVLMSRGGRFVESGDFSSARPVYRRAAESGYAEAALALGGTYDPVALAEKGAFGISPDAAQARHWYERARELGSLEAPTRLERLTQR